MDIYPIIGKCGRGVEKNKVRRRDEIEVEMTFLGLEMVGAMNGAMLQSTFL